MTQDTTLRANTLTQLSSREQLSALMDGALPPNETRFLLRRLQHDAPLAESWDRWRLSGDVMRGLAPTQRLPVDFASRVALALQQDGQPETVTSPARKPVWLRWGGGAAMAASLAVVAGFVAWQPRADDSNVAAAQQVAAAMTVSALAPAPVLPEPATPSLPVASDSLIAATAIAAAARPVRSRDTARNPQAARVSPVVQRERDIPAVAAAAIPVSVPQPDIVTRPWPRSVLPQYAGNPLAAGFAGDVRADAPYNPFQAPALAEIPPLAAERAVPADAAADTASQP